MKLLKSFLLTIAAFTLTVNVIAQCSVNNFSVNSTAVTINYACPDAGIHCTADDNSAQGDAWIKYGAGNGGQLKKPFIFVEGLDLDITSEATHRHGQRGWPNFITGVTDDRDPTEKVFEKAPILINELVARGYDVIYLDHSNGGDYMQNNAKVFVDLIKQINVVKVGGEQIIVAGASMGGQTTKYGICLMEQENYKHCIADYISIDSPHQGANIPLGFQSLLKEYKFLNTQLANVYNGLNLPAARQLLLSHVEASTINQAHSYRATWLSDLSAVGTYPKYCRKTAITSGNITGTELFPAGSQLIDIKASRGAPTCSGGFDVVRLKVWAQPGTAPGNHLFTGKRPEGNNILLLAQNIEACEVNCPVCLLAPSTYFKYDEFNVDASAPKLDNCPGGKRNTAKQFVDKINGPLQNSTIANLLVTATYNQEFHGFVPTTSGLDVNTSDLFLNVQNYIGTSTSQVPSKYPFDAYYGEIGDNKFHVEITGGLASGNIKWLLDEATKIKTPIANPLTAAAPNAGVYNYARFENKLIGSLEIKNGGKLLVNANLLSEYGVNTPMPYFDFKQTPIIGSTYTLETCYCNNVLVEVGNNGEFILGDNNGTNNNKALVLFHEGTTLRIKNGGKLTIRRGSKLIIEAEALLDVQTGGQIVIETGGELILNGYAAKLSSAGKITLNNGGFLTQEPQSVFELNNFSKLIVNDNAKVLVKCNYSPPAANGNNGDAFFIFNKGAEIQLNGNDAVLELNGRLHIGNNAIFSITLPTNSSSGYIKFNRGNYTWDNWANGNQHITCGTNSKFAIVGKNKTDKMIEINQNLVAMPKNITSTSINKSLVEFSHPAAMFESDNTTVLNNATFKGVFPSGYQYNRISRGVLMFGQSFYQVTGCDFLNLGTGLTGALYYGNNSLKNVKNNLFKECEFGVSTIGAGIRLDNNLFIDNDVAINNIGMEYNSYIATNTITAQGKYSETFNFMTGTLGILAHGNNGEYAITNNSINNTNTALLFVNNNNKLRCNNLTSNDYVLYSGTNSKVNMSSLLAGGYNNAGGSKQFARFDEANLFEANMGYNSFRILDQSPCYQVLGHGTVQTYTVCPIIAEGSINNYSSFNTSTNAYDLLAEVNFWRTPYFPGNKIESEYFNVYKAPYNPYISTQYKGNLITGTSLSNENVTNSCPTLNGGGNNSGNGNQSTLRVHPLSPSSSSYNITTASFYNKSLKDALLFSIDKIDNHKNVNKLNQAADLLTEILKYNYNLSNISTTDEYLLELSYNKLFSSVAHLAELYTDSFGRDQMPLALVSRFNDLHSITNLRIARAQPARVDYKESLDLIKLDDALIYGLQRNRTMAIQVIDDIIADDPKNAHYKILSHWRCIYETEQKAIDGVISIEESVDILKNCSATYLPYSINNSLNAKIVTNKLSEENANLPNEEISIIVFPNPTEGEINITYNLKSYESITFELIDVNGRLILKKQLNTAEHQVKIENLNLSNGVYLYKIQGDNKNLITKKIIVAK